MHRPSVALRLVVSASSADLQIGISEFHLDRMKRCGALPNLSGIETQQVLRAQFLQNIRKGAIKLASSLRIKDTTAGGSGQGGQGMLATYVAPRVCLNRDNNDRVKNRI